MAIFQRPPTLERFVIKSILGLREVADTLVDRDEARTTVVDVGDRVTDVDPLPPARASQDSIVFVPPATPT
jgi:hypothetical protein